MDESKSLWSYLPYPALFNIFHYLNHKDLTTVSGVCQSWYEVSRDDFLWKALFFRKFEINKSVPIIPGKFKHNFTSKLTKKYCLGKTWYEEFKRLFYNVPVIQTETLNDHGHQVLHVSFSHNGKYFATCSKDGYVLVNQGFF